MLLDHPWADSSRAPLYVVHMPQSTEAELAGFFDAAEDLYARLPSHQRIALVMDMTSATSVTARQRRISSDHIDRVRDFCERSLSGLAVVVKNPLVRGAITAVSWVSPFPFPFEAFAEREAAIAWARARLSYDDAPARRLA